jgi:GTP pyrophosphokinase
VVIIKLADRLHNMRTLAPLPPEKQLRIARQTMEIYAPLAHRLGMWQIKWELEDLSFKYLQPDAYRKLVEMLAVRRKARETFVNRSLGILRKELAKVGIEAEISGRPKHLYSIYKKMERKGAEFREIYDIHAIRLLVDEVKDCYAALGVVHSIWRPIPGQFDDYIAMPKANMYQSLHTAVIGPEAKPLEVQIRTRQMHELAEAGIAAHWRYKEGSRGDRRYDEKLAWVRQLIDWQREVVDATEFVEGLKLDLFQDQVFVFTPKGDVKDLPANATPLDFAYRIHTDVGHRTIGAKVNNRLVPLDYRLRNGDIVEVVTTKAAHGPSRDWLNIVRTSHAREKIRAWFKRQQRDENITQGKELLDRELRRLAHETLLTIDADKLAEIAQQLHFRELDDFYAAIGYGAVSPASVVSKLEIHDDVEITLPETAPPSLPATTGVKVKGVGDLLVRFAQCCSPIPGDEIAGYVTRGKGVTVHRANCPSVLSERDIERLIDVEWEIVGQQTYPITVRITALDRPGLLNEITNVVAEHKVNIVAASIGTHADGSATITATLKVVSLQQLSRVLSRIERLRDVTSVTREVR